MSGASGKVVAVTGASSGIGAAIAKMLAAHGAKVMLGARRVDRLAGIVADIEADGGIAIARALDVTSRGDVQAFVGATIAAFGRIDVIVNNAGIMPTSRLSALDVDNWDRMIDVNLRGVLHGIAAALPAMEAAGSGHIINMGSVGSYAVGPTTAIYSATKFAVRAISDGLRMESPNIRVTHIAPGITRTELVEHVADDGARAMMQGILASAMPAAAVARTVLFAIEQPEDVVITDLMVRPQAKAS